MAMGPGGARALGVGIVVVMLGAVVALVALNSRKTERVVVVDPAPVPGMSGGGSPPALMTSVGTPTATGGAREPTPVAPSRPAVGVVVGANDAPLANAEVLLATPTEPVDLVGTGRPRGPTTRTDPQGRVSFPPDSPWTAIVVRSSAGYASVEPAELPDDGKIVVRPWGKLEGVVRGGKRPLPDQTVTLAFEGPLGVVATANPAKPYEFVGGGGGRSVRLSQSTRTDAAGRFVFARVPPGVATLAQQGDGRTPTFYGRAVRATSVRVESGQTVQANIGGVGRAITGRARVEGGGGGGVSSRLQGSVQANAPRAGLKVGADWAGKSQEERTRIVEEWYRTVRQPGMSVPLDVAPDGSFRADDLPAGDYVLQLSGYSNDGAGDVSEIAAEGSSSFTVPAATAGSDDVGFPPLDVGVVTVRERPRVLLGSAAPPVKGVRPDGTAAQLADFRGKYVLLSIVPQFDGSSNTLGQEIAMSGPLADRIGSGKLVKAAFLIPWGGPAASRPAAPAAPGWVVATCEDKETVDPRYASSPGTFLVDPDGNVTAKHVGRSIAAYGLVDRTLGFMRDRADGVEVVTEKIAGAGGDSPAFAFKTIPALAADDLGQRATFAVVDGRKAGFGGDISILNDGRAPRHDTDEPLMLTFDMGVLAGRLCADLGKSADVTQVNTYARYKDSHRWTQVYRVYGSDGAAAGFDAAPRIGTDPAACGWTFVAEVDTRTTPGGTDLRDNDRAQAGVSIRKTDGSPLGKYRYLLFLVFADETMNPYGQTFWSEIDVVGKVAGPACRSVHAFDDGIGMHAYPPAPCSSS